VAAVRTSYAVFVSAEGIDDLCFEGESAFENQLIKNDVHMSGVIGGWAIYANCEIASN